MHLHPPGHHFVEVKVGLLMMNSSVEASYIAVVSRPLRKVPGRKTGKSDSRHY